METSSLTSPVIVDGGSGYSVGDTLTVSNVGIPTFSGGGVNYSTATLTVTSINQATENSIQIEELLIMVKNLMSLTEYSEFLVFLHPKGFILTPLQIVESELIRRMVSLFLLDHFLQLPALNTLIHLQEL